MHLRRLTGAWLGPWGPRSQAAIFTGLTQDRHLHRADICSGLSYAQGRHLSRTFISAAQSLAQDLHLDKADTGPAFAQGRHRPAFAQGLHRASTCTGLAFAQGRHLQWAIICTGPSFVQGHHLCRAFICTGPSFAKTIWRPPEGLESVSFINHHKHSPSLNGNLSSWIRQASSNHQTTSRSFIWIVYTGQII